MVLDDEIKRIDDLRNAINKRIDDLRDEFLLLRETDRKNYDEAIRVAYEGVRDRMEGFPAQYATKPDMDGVKGALSKLEKEAIPREFYEERHSALQILINKLDKEKLPESEFQQFVENYRIQQDQAGEERRAVASGLASSTETVANTLLASQERQKGVNATWGRIIVAIGVLATIITVTMSLVVLFSNGKL